MLLQKKYALLNKMDTNKFILLNPEKNLINENNCKYCNKHAQYFRHGDDSYVCKEHLFE